MDEKSADSGFPRAVFATVFVMLAVFLDTAIDSGRSVVWATVFIAFAGGAVARSWSAPLVLPLAIGLAALLADRVSGPDAAGRSEGVAAQLFVAAIVLFGCVLAVASAGGVLAARALSAALESRRASFPRAQSFLLGGSGLMAAALVAAFVFVADRNSQRLGPIVGQREGVTLWAGQPWDGRGQGRVSERDALKSTGVGIFWFGPEFAGFRLTGIYANARPDGRGGYSESLAAGATIGYGACTTSDGGCGWPVSVVSNPICGAFMTPQSGIPTVIRGGAWLRHGDGGLEIWTGNTAVSFHGISIYSGDYPEGQLLDALQVMNAVAATGVEAEVLRPPDFAACPDHATILPPPP